VIFAFFVQQQQQIEKKEKRWKTVYAEYDETFFLLRLHISKEITKIVYHMLFAIISMKING
jgi:hypothetical protein